ncbi:MAG TPA: helix-turn-helix transcriptional regulator [Candidatus Limosilactobacillus faecipullorum]|nr:helix-turn-helix transcriptional regulator [Candidatus Limosilactobacillus faecipullorum]
MTTLTSNKAPKKAVQSEVAITLQVIGGKWKPLILHYLMHAGPQRYSAIFRYLKSAPKKTLTAQLKELMADGIVDRQVLNTSPVQVQYQVTEHGMTLYPLLEMMCAWGFVNGNDQYEVIHRTCEPTPDVIAEKQHRLDYLADYFRDADKEDQAR